MSLRIHGSLVFWEMLFALRASQLRRKEKIQRKTKINTHRMNDHRQMSFHTETQQIKLNFLLTNACWDFGRCPIASGLTETIWFADQFESIATLISDATAKVITFASMPAVGDIGWLATWSWFTLNVWSVPRWNSFVHRLDWFGLFSIGFWVIFNWDLQPFLWIE